MKKTARKLLSSLLATALILTTVSAVLPTVADDGWTPATKVADLAADKPILKPGTVDNLVDGTYATPWIRTTSFNFKGDMPPLVTEWDFNEQSADGEWRRSLVYGGNGANNGQANIEAAKTTNAELAGPFGMSVALGQLMGINNEKRYIASSPWTGASLIYMAAEGEMAQSSQLQLTIFRNILASANLNADISATLESMLNGMLNVSWKCGLQIVIFMTALRNISASVREAATIEGATGWEYFWKIAFPMISPVFQLNLIYSIIDSFTDYSNDIVAWIDGLASSIELTASTTLACIYYGIIFVIIGVLFLLLRKRVFYYTD